MLCTLCPRECAVNREKTLGYCKSPWQIKAAKAMLHNWEEPPISGTNGSGAVFFSGCNLGCVFCQNYDISHNSSGKEITQERLLEIFFELKEKGAHNINLVNPTHYAQSLKSVLLKFGKALPVVYNSSGYEKVSTLKMLEGLVDIYLPDLKYISPERSSKYSKAENYFEFASKALIEMKRQVPENVFSEDGIMQKGMIIRHLVLPKNTKQSMLILDWIKENLGTDTAVSIMSQYTPYGDLQNCQELQRRVTKREYEKVLSYALEIGFSNIYSQEFSSASEEFIPDFNFSGI